MKKFFALLLAVVMVLSMAACGNTTEETKAPVATDATKATDATTEKTAFDAREICEGVTLTIAVASDQEVIDWDTCLSTKMVEEALGVDLVFEVYPSADYASKLNVMIQGGDKLPDIIMSTRSSALKGYLAWADAGAIIPLNEYYENEDYAHYINLACEEYNIDLGSYLKDADGLIWGSPKYNVTPPNANGYKLLINEEYLDKLGMDMPVTAEDFYNVCKAFAEAGDINENGLNDEVAMAGQSNLKWFQYLMSAYAYAFDNYYMDVVDGKLSYSFTTDEWKEGLKYIKKFFDEGIFDTTLLTQDSTAHNAIIKNNDAPWLCDVNYLPQTPSNVVKTQYGYVPGLASEYKVAESYWSPVMPGVGAVITTDCKNPDAAFLVLDYMCSEEISIVNRYGERGVDWDYWADVDEAKLPEGTKKADYTSNYPELFEDPYVILYSASTYFGQGNPQNAGYMQAGTLILGDKMYWGRALLEDSENEEEMANAVVYLRYNENYWNTFNNYVPDETIDYLPMTAEESTTASNLWSTLNDYVTESIGAFLTGEWDIDSYWDTYLTEIERIGAAELLEIVQTSYDRNK